MNFHPPIIPRVLFALILFWTLTACGSIQDHFTFQPEPGQSLFYKSPFPKQKINKFSDHLLLVNIDHLQNIPNAPILLLPPLDPRPDIPIDQLLAPLKPPQPLKPIAPAKSIAKPKPKRQHTYPIWDDLDRASLVQAVANQLQLLNHGPQEGKFIPSAKKAFNKQLKETLRAFLNLLKQNLSQREFQQRILDDFEFLSAETESNRKILLTGYYTPIIEASRIQAPGYEFPIYEKPENLARTRYIYRQHFKGEAYSRLYFTEGPNYTREDIDGRHLLDNRHLEIAWLKDEMDRYFLHIQGSGVLKFPDGTFQGVQYTGSNGYRYQSVGQMLLKEGVIPISKGSMQEIKKHFRENPKDISKYVYQNKRYIFFKRSDGSPRGASGAPVVEGRSIAVDPTHYPYGALGLVSAKKPILNDDHEITAWKKFSRFVVAQDTGAAIKGPSHVDLYFGMGKRAAAAAGRFMQKGTLFFLRKKQAE